MTLISKNVYIDKLDDIVNKYNNTCRSTIKMKSVDVKSNTYIDSSKEINDKNPKFKTGDNVRISKHKNVFAKGYAPNWSEEVFVIKKVKNIVPWTYIISYLNEEEIVGTFYEKELQKTNQKEFRIEKLLIWTLKLTKNADPDKCKYSGYGIGFDSRSEFLFTGGSYGKHVIIFVADMSSSMHVDNKGKDILILGEELTQVLDDDALTAEDKYPVNFKQ